MLLEDNEVGDARDRRWRLLIFSSECLVGGYGSSSALRTFVRAALEYTRWDLTLVVPRIPKAENSERFPGARIVGIPTVGTGSRRTQLLAYTALASLRSPSLVDERPDVVISWQPTPSAVPGRIAAKFGHAAHIVRTCGPELARQWSRFPLITSMSKPLTRRSLASADAVVIKSPLERSLLDGVIADQRVRLIPNAVDSRFFVTPRTNAHTTRFLSVGQLEAHKGLDQLIPAFATATGQGRYSLTIAGEGSQRTHLERIALATQADIEFVGRIPHPEMPEVYASHDALILASPLEASSNTCLEAMAAGLPVIGTRTALNDLVHDGENGVLAETGTAAQIALALDRFLANENRLPAFRSAARRTAERHHPEHLVRSYGELFAELLHQGARR